MSRPTWRLLCPARTMLAHAAPLAGHAALTGIIPPDAGHSTLEHPRQ